MELTRQSISRETLSQVARLLYDVQAGADSCRLQRTLRDCAARIEAAARSLPSDPNATPFLRPEVADLARGLKASLGISHHNAGRLLALLLVRPGRTISGPELAASLGIAPASIRVFAFHLRNWLSARGLSGALECRWGVGYAIAPPDANLILQDSFHLSALVRAIRAGVAAGSDAVDDPDDCSETLFDFRNTVPGADPFPIVRHRALDARVLA